MKCSFILIYKQEKLKSRLLQNDLKVVIPKKISKGESVLLLDIALKIFDSSARHGIGICLIGNV